MALLARVVVPGVPRYMIQRSNRRQMTFFNEADYAGYLELMAQWCVRCGAAVRAYCLMLNHANRIKHKTGRPIAQDPEEISIVSTDLT